MTAAELQARIVDAKARGATTLSVRVVDLEALLATLRADAGAQRERAAKRPEVVCLCGSTRFIDAFSFHYGRLTDEGKIVLSVGRVVPQSEQALGSARKVMLDELHKRKIDLCDRVFVLNVGGYIGSSTRSEIDYANAHGKPVDYLEPSRALAVESPSPGPSPASGNETCPTCGGDHDCENVRDAMRVCYDPFHPAPSPAAKLGEST